MIRFSELSSAQALGKLQSGRRVWTDVEDDRDYQYYKRGVYLDRMDLYCDSCRDHMDVQEFGEYWANVMARMKLNHSGTWCPDCFRERVAGAGSEEDTPDDDRSNDDKAGRTFG